jgi:hypothetical protein
MFSAAANELSRKVKEIGDSALGKNAEKNNYLNSAQKYTQNLYKECKVNEDFARKIPCINEHLEGKRHPVSGVKFERKVVYHEGQRIEGVFPKFDSKFDANIQQSDYNKSDKTQFDKCNAQLKAAVERDPVLRKKFNDRQLEQIKNGVTPSGYTWHHNEQPGKMQLVESKIHATTAHTGGRSIWGGGSDNR